jgi:phosphocarrier protein
MNSVLFSTKTSDDEFPLDMTEIKTFEIKNKLGMHARPAAKLAGISSQYKSEIFFERDGQVVDGKSLLNILTLACPMGSMITIRAEGADAHEAIEALEKLIECKFGED